MIIQLVIQIQSDLDPDSYSNTFKEITVLGDPEGIRELHHILGGISPHSERIARLIIKNLDGVTVSPKEFFRHPNAEASPLSYNCNHY